MPRAPAPHGLVRWWCSDPTGRGDATGCGDIMGCGDTIAISSHVRPASLCVAASPWAPSFPGGRDA